MFVSMCIVALTFGVINQSQSSVVNHLQKKEVPVTKTIYTCPMHPEIVSNKPGKCPICKMELVKKEISTKDFAKLVYTCSMHPIVMSAKPGKCPICKMGLVKKSAMNMKM